MTLRRAIALLLLAPVAAAAQAHAGLADVTRAFKAHANSDQAAFEALR